MSFNQPEVIEMGQADELISIVGFSKHRESPPDPEPAWDPIPIYIPDECSHLQLAATWQLTCKERRCDDEVQ